MNSPCCRIMPEHYSLLDNVILSPEIRAKVKRLADRFHAATQKDILITSGFRTSQSQAVAMYDKLAAGDDFAVYKNQAAAQTIRRCYTQGLKASKSRDAIITEIKAEIDQQISENVYISQHLRYGAVDIRSRDMSDDEKQIFIAIAEQVAESVILETTPPHFHVQL